MQRMNTNQTTQKSELLYPQLSFTIVGVLFDAHNELGPYAREKQYGDSIEAKFKFAKIPYRRECAIGTSTNIADFIINDLILIELKSKRLLLREDYEQTQRYLQAGNLRLGLLVNFRNKYLKPVRVVKIDSPHRNY